LTDSAEIFESWRVYCDNLNNEEDAVNADVSQTAEEVEMEPVPLWSEVATVLKSLSAGKAVGPDEIPIELLQQGGEKIIGIFHKLIVTVWRTGVWPADWC
jgi:hypothetical protein